MIQDLYGRLRSVSYFERRITVMGEIKDFKCTYGSVGISEEITRDLPLEFPDAYMHWDTMVILADALKKRGDVPFAELPFCHTVEGEALGGIINYGDARFGPRTGAYQYDNLEDIMDIPPIDFETGRIHEVLLACQAIRQKGEQVVLDVSGPFTMLNVLLDPKYIFKGIRKQPEFMKALFMKLGDEAIRYIVEAARYGVNMISYADSAGGVNILGPKLAKQIVHDFTYPFLKKLDNQVTDDMLIMLCPKTTFSLIGAGVAEFADIKLEKPMTYGEACMSMIGKTRFVGQRCMKDVMCVVKDRPFKLVQLK